MSDFSGEKLIKKVSGISEINNKKVHFMTNNTIHARFKILLPSYFYIGLRLNFPFRKCEMSMNFKVMNKILTIKWFLLKSGLQDSQLPERVGGDWSLGGLSIKRPSSYDIWHMTHDICYGSHSHGLTLFQVMQRNTPIC